jgi:hypothetical protein
MSNLFFIILFIGIIVFLFVVLPILKKQKTKDTDTTGKLTVSDVTTILNHALPKEKEDWTCSFCNTLNKGDSYNCNNCGAGKSI